MIFKTRSIPYTLPIFDAVARRMRLSREDRKEHYNLGKGYEGEVPFDTETAKLGDGFLVLNDLLLFCEKYFQLDALVVAGNKLSIYEIKNHEGAAYYRDGLVYNLSHKEILNPDLEVETKATYLRRLLHSHGLTMPIEAFTVFINPNFFLYQLPTDARILVPALLDRHFQNLTRKARPVGTQQVKLANLLKTLHIVKFPYAKLPKYTWETLRKGVSCPTCHSFAIETRDYYCYCLDCSGKERVAQAIVRHTEEFKLLFPEKKVTATAITEWCDHLFTRTRVQRTLARAYRQYGKTHGTYYI